MVDNNMSHEVLRRFERIEARLEALEQQAPQEEDEEEEEA